MSVVRCYDWTVKIWRFNKLLAVGRRPCSYEPHSTVYSSAYIRSVFSRATPSQRGIRYSSGVCLSLSVNGRSSVETAGRIELVFGTEASFAALCFREVWATAKLRDGLPSGTFPRLWTWTISPRHVAGRRNVSSSQLDNTSSVQLGRQHDARPRVALVHPRQLILVHEQPRDASFTTLLLATNHE